MATKVEIKTIVAKIIRKGPMLKSKMFAECCRQNTTPDIHQVFSFLRFPLLYGLV
jgi:hypothetical protein